MGCGPSVVYSLPGNIYGEMASAFSAEQCCNSLCPVLPSPAPAVEFVKGTWCRDSPSCPSQPSSAFICFFYTVRYRIYAFTKYQVFLPLKRHKTAPSPSICSMQQRDRKCPGISSAGPNNVIINQTCKQTLVQVLTCWCFTRWCHCAQQPDVSPVLVTNMGTSAKTLLRMHLRLTILTTASPGYITWKGYICVSKSYPDNYLL